MSLPRQYVVFTSLFFVASITTFLLSEQLGLDLEPYWIVLPVLCIPPVIVLIHRFPAALIPPMIFVGVFKSQAASSNMDFRDPTFLVFLLLLATVLVHGLLTLAGIESPTLSSLVRGHVEGIVTYMVFVAVVALSFLYSQAPDYGFTALTHFAVVGSAVYFATFLLVRSERDIRHVIASSVLLSLVLVGREFITRQPEAVEDPTKLGAGELLGMSLLLLLLAPQDLRIRLPRSLLLLCLAWLAVGLTISIARGALLSFTLIVVLSFLSSNRDAGLLPRKAMAAVLILLVIPAFFVSLYWLQNTAPEKVATKQGEFTKLLELSDPGGTVGRRLELYRQAIEGFAEKPFLGWGIGSFSVYAAGSDKRLYPHNLVLLIAVEQGLLGLAAFAALLIALARALKKIIAVTEGKWVFLVWVILYCLTNAMFSGDLDDQRALLLWCGVAFASCRMLTLRLRERPPFTEGRVAVAST